jgi:exosortase/archaeosortase family protein
VKVGAGGGPMRVDNISHNNTQAIKYVLLYAISFLALASIMYYYPDYSTLEAMTAEHSAGILNAIGISAHSAVIGKEAYVNNIQIVRECTGIQVVAVFAGILFPLPRISWQVKLKAIVILSFAVYIANVLRVAVEMWLLYEGLLPWEMIHGTVGAVLGVVTVFLFFLIADRFIPQIGTYLDGIADWMADRFRNRGSAVETKDGGR